MRREAEMGKVLGEESGRTKRIKYKKGGNCIRNG
jgi:hypothetical protein